MYGPGHPPQPTPMPPRRLPSRAWIVSMRVLFVVLSVGSIGLLLWAPLLRLAIVRRRTSDWWLTGAGFVFVCVLLPIVGRDGSNADANGIDFVLIPMLFLAMLAAPVYYLVADIRHYEQLEKQPFAAWVPAAGAGVRVPDRACTAAAACSVAAVPAAATATAVPAASAASVPAPLPGCASPELATPARAARVHAHPAPPHRSGPRRARRAERLPP